MSPVHQEPGKADDLAVVRLPLRRSWGILVRRFPGPATPSDLNRPVTPGWYGIR